MTIFLGSRGTNNSSLWRGTTLFPAGRVITVLTGGKARHLSFDVGIARSDYDATVLISYGPGMITQADYHL